MQGTQRQLWAYVLRTLLLVHIWAFAALTAGANELVHTLADIRGGIVAVVNFDPLAQPRAKIIGTGFAVDDGGLIVTNFHVVNAFEKGSATGRLAILVGRGKDAKMHEVAIVSSEPLYDIALLQITDGARLKPLQLASSAYTMAEGSDIAMTGFPLGQVLGLYPITHKGIISAHAPNIIPQGNARFLNPEVIRRQRFLIYQLDITSYPGNSGSPVYDPADGKVVAILNAAYVRKTRENGLGEATGISYAIPVKFISRMITDSKKKR